MKKLLSLVLSMLALLTLVGCGGVSQEVKDAYNAKVTSVMTLNEKIDTVCNEAQVALDGCRAYYDGKVKYWGEDSVFVSASYYDPGLLTRLEGSIENLKSYKIEIPTEVNTEDEYNLAISQLTAKETVTSEQIEIINLLIAECVEAYSN